MSHVLEKNHSDVVPAGRRLRRRRAMATLVVLLLISITLAISYSLLRSQSTADAVQRNCNLGQEARLAAMAGINAGLKRMHVWDKNDASRCWTGVGTTLTQPVSSTARFEVRFATGDPSLTTDDPWLTSSRPTLRSDRDDTEEFPYRVTLFATGIAVDPGDRSREVKHQVRAVVRLVPRALESNKPAGFDRITNGVGGDRYTLCQSSPGDFRINVPFRVQGRVRAQGSMKLALTVSDDSCWYAWSNEARVRYLKELNLMRLAGYEDCRPFAGPIDLPYASQDSGFLSLLTTMGISTVDTAASSLSGWIISSTRSTYQLYPGGKAYPVTTVSGQESNTTWKPDPVSNPAGILYCNGQLWLGDNVRIQGTVLTRANDVGDVMIAGKNVHLEPAELPSLYGSTAAVQLPVIVAGDDVHILEGSQASIAGLVISADDFKITEDSQYASLAVTVSSDQVGKPLQAVLPAVFSNYSATECRRMIVSGSVRVSGSVVRDPATVVQSGQNIVVYPRILLSRVVARDIYVGGRSEWLSWQASLWELCYNLFRSQENVNGGTRWWAEWLDWWGRNRIPQLGIAPDATQPTPWYHWQTSQNPIYMPHPDDEGLRWELLEWTDNP